MNSSDDPDEREEVRVALVMAATSGIGQGCAQALAQDHRIAICARSPRGVDSEVKRLRNLGAEAVGCAADVSDGDQLTRVFDLIGAAYGRLDVMVVNAGGPAPGAFMTLDDAAWQRGFELTFMSAIHAIRSAVPRMVGGGFGRIIVIGSSSVRQPIENLALSNVFRPALVGLVKTLAIELAPQGITVNMVSPGRVDTPRVRTLDEARARARGIAYEEFRANSERVIPLGRYGQPEDVAGLVAYLASEGAGYITGQSILVDGGMIPSLP